MLEYLGWLLVGYLLNEIYRLSTSAKTTDIKEPLKPIAIMPAQRSITLSDSSIAHDSLITAIGKKSKVIYVENPLEDEEDIHTAVLN